MFKIREEKLAQTPTVNGQEVDSGSGNSLSHGKPNISRLKFDDMLYRV